MASLTRVQPLLSANVLKCRNGIEPKDMTVKSVKSGTNGFSFQLDILKQCQLQVQAFLEDADSVLSALDGCQAEEKCLMLIRRPKEAAKKMLKSQSLCNLSVSEPQLYHQFSSGKLGSLQLIPNSKQLPKSKLTSDQQSVTSDDIDNLDAHRHYISMRGKDNWRQAQKSSSDHQSSDSNYHTFSDSSSASDYQAAGLKYQSDRDVIRRNERYPSIPEDEPEINNNSSKGNNSRLASSQEVPHESQNGECDQQWKRVHNRDQPYRTSEQISNDKFYKSGKRTLSDSTVDPGDLETSSRSQSWGNLSTGLTLSVVGQRKADSMLDLSSPQDCGARNCRSDKFTPANSKHRESYPESRPYPGDRSLEKKGFAKDSTSYQYSGKRCPKDSTSYSQACTEQKSHYHKDRDFFNCNLPPVTNQNIQNIKNEHLNTSGISPHHQLPQSINNEHSYINGHPKPPQSVNIEHSYTNGNSKPPQSVSNEHSYTNGNSKPPQSVNIEHSYTNGNSKPPQSVHNENSYTNGNSKPLQSVNNEHSYTNGNSKPPQSVNNELSYTNGNSKPLQSVHNENSYTNGNSKPPQSVSNEHTYTIGNSKPPQSVNNEHTYTNANSKPPHSINYEHTYTNGNSKPHVSNEHSYTKGNSKPHQSVNNEHTYTNGNSKPPQSVNNEYTYINGNSKPHVSNEHSYTKGNSKPHQSVNNEHTYTNGNSKPSQSVNNEYTYTNGNSKPSQSVNNEYTYINGNSQYSQPYQSVSNEHSYMKGNSQYQPALLNDIPPPKPKRSLPHVPSIETTQRIKHFTEMMRSRISVSSSAGRSTANSDCSQTSNTPQAALSRQNSIADNGSDCEVSALLDAGSQEGSTFSNRSEMINKQSQYHEKHKRELFQEDRWKHQNQNLHNSFPRLPTMQMTPQSCSDHNSDSRQTPYTSHSHSSTMDSGYTTNTEGDAETNSVFVTDILSPSHHDSLQFPHRNPGLAVARKYGSLQNVSSVHHNSRHYHNQHPYHPHTLQNFHGGDRPVVRNQPLMQESSSTKSQDLFTNKDCPTSDRSWDLTQNVKSLDFQPVVENAPQVNQQHGQEEMLVKPQAVAVVGNIRQLEVNTPYQNKYATSRTNADKYAGENDLITGSGKSVQDHRWSSEPNSINTLPGHWKYSNSSNNNNNTNTKVVHNQQTSPKVTSPPTLFQLSQSYDLRSVRLILPDNMSVKDVLTLTTVQAILPGGNQSPDNNSRGLQSPKGGPVQLGGPGSAFRPVRTGQITVGVTGIGLVKELVQQLCTVGDITVGDLLVELNGWYSLNSDHSSVQRVLENCQGEVTLTLARKREDLYGTRLKELETGLQSLHAEVSRLKEELAEKDARIQELSTIMPWRKNESTSSCNKVLLETEGGTFVIGDNEFVV